MTKYQFELWSHPDTKGIPRIFYVDDPKLDFNSIGKLVTGLPQNIKTKSDPKHLDSVVIWVTEVQGPNPVKSHPEADKLVMSVGQYISNMVFDIAEATDAVDNLLRKANLSYRRLS